MEILGPTAYATSVLKPLWLKYIIIIKIIVSKMVSTHDIRSLFKHLQNYSFQNLNFQMKLV